MKLAVGVEVALDVAVNVEVKEFVGVGVACATVTVAPATDIPLNDTACPLVPLAPVRLNV